MKLLRNLKVFRKTTKFKRFTFGVSKNTSIRKTYIKKKRVSSNVVFQYLVRHWCHFYLKKKTMESFTYFLFAFPYTIPVPHIEYISKRVTHKNFTEKISFHSSLVSKKTVYNTSIFRKENIYFKYLKSNVRFQESAFVSFNKLPKEAHVLPKLLPWGVVIGAEFHNPRLLASESRLNSYYVAQWSRLATLTLRLLLGAILELRKIWQTTLLLIKL